MTMKIICKINEKSLIFQKKSPSAVICHWFTEWYPSYAHMQISRWFIGLFFFILLFLFVSNIFQFFYHVCGMEKPYMNQRMESTAQYNMVFSGKYICEYNVWWILTDYHTYANFKVRTLFFYSKEVKTTCT